MRQPIAAVVLSFLAISVLAQGVAIHNGIFTGNDFREFSDRDKQLYSAGLTDGMMLAPLIGTEDRAMTMGNCMTGMTTSQVSAIFEKWLSENPELWHQDAHVLMYQTILDFCPLPARE